MPNAGLDTRVPYDADRCIHQLFEEQVARTPDTVAVIFRNDPLTYRELDARANQLARRLQQLGVGPGSLVGICLERSLEMMVGLLAILKAGGAYLPLDPSYPRERLAFMLEDAQVPVVLTRSRLAGSLPEHAAQVVAVDADWPAIAQLSPERPTSGARSENLAYVIYTSGSTGKPKGVMVTHRNVVNFFAGMDQRIGPQPGVWLAVTSISFDISVLELFWTLARGFKVVLQEDEAIGAVWRVPSAPTAKKTIEFSLFYFAGDERQNGGKYQLLTEGARFADQNGFTAVWTPERHFHAFGGLFPNPSVTSAALAMITQHVQIRAGSIVLPLHDPLRVAEEWSVVDNLSHGRVGVSFASGWHDRDFVFAPHHYAERKKVMFREIETVRALWRGEAIQRQRGGGENTSVSILPRPVQPELPVWVTAGGDPETFRLAGESRSNLLTHLLGQSMEELAAKIAVYRKAWSGEGQGHVTLMLHTYVGNTPEEVAEKVRGPFCEYLKTSVDLMKQVAKGLGVEFASGNLTPADLESLIDHAFHRYFETSGLFGTPDTCLALVERLKAMGVDEVACLIDFGIEPEAVLASLENLRLLMERANHEQADRSDFSIPEQIVAHGISHLQCTPSRVRMLLMTPEGPRAVGSLRKLMVGGEALPQSLAEQLHALPVGEIFNMYGPTETTIWSTTHRLVKGENPVPIGRPIANTSVYVLDESLSPVPTGEAGELFLGGDGVVAGYLNRPELTAEKFIANPFSSEAGSRLYRTGDLVRFSRAGVIEFLGRVDHQVKIRGFRIEPGEIEAVLDQHPHVRQAIVSSTEDSEGTRSLVAYVQSGEAKAPTVRELRRFVGTKLPAHMVPSTFVFLESFPLTPNGKIDRRMLPKPGVSQRQACAAAAPSALEEKLSAIWADVLRVERVGVRDNFFDLGGHSLSAVQMTFLVRRAFAVELPLQAVFDFPTVSGLAAELEARITQPGASFGPQPAITPAANRRKKITAPEGGAKLSA
ncbi:MAG: LLM class flavin-dependent oxidoreductase [Acidobacteriia bacterium]|nr:LLM class flavin-dependent oxidoreductase [Terriglobia bacterium]